MERRGRELAASIAQTHNLQPNNNGRRAGGSGTGPMMRNATMGRSSNGTVPTMGRSPNGTVPTTTTQAHRTGPTPSSHPSPQNPGSPSPPGSPTHRDTPTKSTTSAKKVTAKRKRKQKNLEAPATSKFSTSHLLRKKPHLWPEDDEGNRLPEEEVDCYSMEVILGMKTFEAASKQQETKDMIGTKMAKLDANVKEVIVKEGKDNCRDILHDDRWNLRPILEHPKKWYHRVKVKWPEVIRNIDLEFMGADLQINARTIASRHDRSIFIEAKHLLPKNHNVEARPSITKSSMRQGKLEHVTEYDYQDPETLEEMLTAVANLAAIDHRLWNQDYTHIVLSKTAAKFKFFKEAGGDSVRVFNDFFNKIMEANAGDPTRHPRVYEEAVRIAKNVMEAWGYTSEVPSHRSALGLGAPPNQDRGKDRFRQGGDGRDRGRDSRIDSHGPIGKIPRNLRQLQVRGEEVCFDFNKRACKKPLAAGGKGCLAVPGGSKVRLHVCGITASLVKGEPVLCGQPHPALKCSKRNN